MSYSGDDTAGPPDLDDLLEAAEPNPLLRRVDGLCEDRAWDELVILARRCREAYERGKQLWPIAEHIDYRLALEAPPAYAAGVLSPEAGRFAFGPLTEVAASTHTFDDLAPHLPSPQVAGVVAAERVLRGEDLRGHPDAHPEVLELPMRLEAWEPAYGLATFKAHEFEAPSPELAPLSETNSRRGASGAGGEADPSRVRAGGDGRGTPLDEPELHRALVDLAAAWVDGSGGRAEAAVVEGGPAQAVSALGVGSFLMSEIDAGDALALMAWAAASGGAHGRRRGAAAGRSSAWWVAAELCGLSWPVDPGELARELARLHWFRWEPPSLGPGWNLHVAVESPDEGWAAAVGAEDRAE